MTRKEAIAELNKAMDEISLGSYTYDGLERSIALEMAIKALEQEPNIDMDSEEIKILQKRSYLEGFHEALKMSVKQEPCEDAISREQLVRELNAQMAVDAISREVALDMLEHLPSIQPKPKTGHWFYDKSIENWRCSECKETPKTMGYCGSANFMSEHFKFCNHCGTRMVETQESEG